MKKYGIDVSVHNGAINWPKVAQEVDFAIIRAGYGRTTNQEDKKFLYNYNNAKNNGVPVGAYWYSYALTPTEAKKEAEACLQVIKGKQFEYPVYFDIEETKTFATGKKNVSAICKAFCETLENAGYFVGIYSSASAFKSYFDNECLAMYSIWTAHWGVQQPSFPPVYGMWQTSDNGSCNGIAGHVDTNYCYQDFPDIIKKAGLNGYQHTDEPEPDNKPITLDIGGDKYSGTVTKQ